jgi:hypothetical protein
MDLSSDEVKRFATQSTFFDFDQAIVVRIGSWSRILHRDEHTSHGIDFKPHKKAAKTHTKNTFLYFPWARVWSIIVICSFTSFFPWGRADVALSARREGEFDLSRVEPGVVMRNK